MPIVRAGGGIAAAFNGQSSAPVAFIARRRPPAALVDAAESKTKTKHKTELKRRPVCITLEKSAAGLIDLIVIVYRALNRVSRDRVDKKLSCILFYFFFRHR